MPDPKILTFLTLCETMNYHLTAERLHMTQPAVTQHIKALETDYGCRLFHYDRKLLTKTHEAELFEIYARSAVFNEKNLRLNLTKPAVRVFRIGATKSIGEYMISEPMAKFLADESRTAEITVDNTEHLLAMLDSGSLDFALIEGLFSKSRYASRLFRVEPMTGICAPGHRFDRREVAITELFDETLILREPGSGTREIFTGILAEHGYSKEDFRRTVTASEFELLCSLVRRGVGISFVYQSVADHGSDIGKFALKDRHPSHELNYVYLKDTTVPAMIDEFEDSIN